MSTEPKAAATAPAPLKQGDVLGGKFRVERLVGKGGMGVVMEATNVQLDQKVALKLLARNADDPAVVERFMREAKAAARLKSEHVARVFDVGKDPAHGPYIVMELLDGSTLAEVLQKARRVPLHKAVEHVIDACEGLAEAHARGIVHQDIKPGNLFLVAGDDGRPSVKVLDFGIATMRSKDDPANKDSKSSAPRSQGTPAYLSPEQLKGNPPVDHRADVWALGCVLYELVSGERAFRATRFTELVTKILEAPPDTLPLDVELPDAVALIIDKCLQKDPTKRYNSTGELALALLPFARRRAHSSVAKAVAHVKTGGLDPDLQMPSSMPPPPIGAADSGPTDVASVPNLRAPSVPSFSNAPGAKTSDAPAPPARSKSALAIAVVFGAVALGGGAFAISRAFDKPVPSDKPVSTTPPKPTELVAAPTTPASATVPIPAAADSTPPSTSGAEEPLEAPAIPAVMTTARRFRPPAPRPTGAPAPTPAPVQETEIRRTR